MWVSIYIVYVCVCMFTASMFTDCLLFHAWFKNYVNIKIILDCVWMWFYAFSPSHLHYIPGSKKNVSYFHFHVNENWENSAFLKSSFFGFPSPLRCACVCVRACVEMGGRKREKEGGWPPIHAWGYMCIDYPSLFLGKIIVAKKTTFPLAIYIFFSIQYVVKNTTF